MLALVGLGLAVAGAMLAAACGSDPGNVAAGGDCFAASDCQPGLVCIPPKNGNGNSVCSNDLTTVTGKPPPEGGAAEAGDATVNDAPVNDAPVDTGTDTGAGADTGGPADAGDAG